MRSDLYNENQRRARHSILKVHLARSSRHHQTMAMIFALGEGHTDTLLRVIGGNLLNYA